MNPTNVDPIKVIPVFSGRAFEFSYGPSYFDKRIDIRYGFYRDTSQIITGTTNYLFIPPQDVSNRLGNKYWRFSNDGINFKLIKDTINEIYDESDIVNSRDLDPEPILIDLGIEE